MSPLAVDPRVKRAAKENETRVHTTSSRRSNAVARLLEPSTGNSRKAERGNLKKEHRRPDPNNPSIIAMTAPERKFRSRFL
jgi:hypothetical protein